MDSSNLQERVIQALSEKIPNAKCPLCGADEWSVQVGTTYLPLETQFTGSASWNQRAFPSIALICENCGNTHLMNLSILLPDLVNKVR